jgi:hypothetical protein
MEDRCWLDEPPAGGEPQDRLRSPVGPAARLALLTATLAACASAKPEWAPWRGEIDNDPSREEIAEADVVSMQFCRGLGGAEKAGRYGWLTAGRVYWLLAKQEGCGNFLVGAPGGGAPAVRLTGDIAALKRFITLQFNGRLPSVRAQ